MTMTGSERPRAQQVLDDIHIAYLLSLQYKLINSFPANFDTPSPNEFAATKKNIIAPMLLVENWTSQHKEKDSFFAEWMVMLGLRKVFSQAGLDAELAPPHLENGFKGRTGVDVIISKGDSDKKVNLPILAINVKLKKPKIEQRAESYRYDQMLACPSIELGLGDFAIQTKKSGQVTILSWLREVVTPNLVNSGHVPDFQLWERYLLQKTAATVFHYMIKVDNFLCGGYQPSANEINFLPTSDEELEQFYDNLSFAYMTLKEICEKNDLRII